MNNEPSSRLLGPTANEYVCPVNQTPLAHPGGVPEGVRPFRLYWSYASFIPLIHLLALLACVPWLFSWTGVILVFVGHYFFGMLGITLGYHRLLTHRGFTCSKMV